MHFHQACITQPKPSLLLSAVCPKAQVESLQIIDFYSYQSNQNMQPRQIKM